MSILQLTESAELAFAAYATLQLGENSEADIRSNNSGVPATLATSIANNYRVIAILDDAASGAYAAVFEDKLTGARTLAIRGTTDLRDIAADTYVLSGTPPSLNPQYQALASQVIAWQAQGIVGSATAVTGHSLGGYLVTALKSNAAVSLGSATTFNAPGLGSAVGSLSEFFQSAFGISALSPDILDVRGSAGLSLIAGLGQHWGTVLPVEIEAAGGAGLGNHLISKLAASLAVMRMWSALDPTLTIDRANQWIAASSDVSGSSLEKAVEATLRLLSGPSAGPSIPTDDANALYTHLLALTARDAGGAYSDPAVSALAGQLRIELGGAALASTARADFSALVSLISLSPLVLGAVDAAGRAALDSVLQAGWGEAWGEWQADREAVAAGGVADNHSDAWLADRALLLEASLGFNASGRTAGAGLPTDRYIDLAWRDGANVAHALLVGGSAAQPLDAFEILPTQRVAFGGDADDALTGTANAEGDHLYGGAGNDTVVGLAGDDRLEGNAGDDALDGGDGSDWLRGGAGADTLDGGSGASSDTLAGGAGADLYRIGAHAGLDTVLTSDAADRLELDGRVLDGSGTLLASAGGIAVWQDRSASAGTVTYSFNTATHELTVRGGGSTVRVLDFEAGDLGIDASATEPATPADTAVFADLGGGAHSGGWRDDGFGAAAGLAEHLVNFNQAQTAFVPVSFRIDSRGGDDWIEGGAGVSAVPVHVTAGSGHDALYAGMTQTLAELLAEQDAAAASGRSDLLLDGGADDDRVFGGAGDDALFGGAGNDTLAGGAGRDVIFSDGDSGQRLADWRDGFTSARWVAGDNTAGATLYFNGYAGFGTISHYTPDSAYPAGSETQFYNWQFGLESTDFTPLGALNGVALAGSDYLAGWTVYADGRFDGSVSQVGAPDPQAGVYFNTNRHRGDDAVFAGAGNDLVNAGGGDDYVDAGSGDDVVSGYQGDDQISGGSGNDTLLGDAYAMDDRPTEAFLGAAYRQYALDPSRPDQAHGNDHLDGGDGNDRLEGNGGADVLIGGLGNDTLFGDESRQVNGRLMPSEYAGGDWIDAGEGHDIAMGGARDDFIAGGLGNDTLYGDNAFVDNTPAAGLPATGRDTLDGGAGNDQIFGEGGDDTLWGGDGADTLMGGAGHDVLSGGRGADMLDGGSGADLYLYNLGDGSDTLIDDGGSASGADELRLGAGITADSLRFVRANGDLILALPDELDRITLRGWLSGANNPYQIETVRLGDGTVWSAAQLTEFSMQVRGSAGADVLRGSAERADRLFGLAGNDTLSATGIGDTLDGGDGDDLLDAGDNRYANYLTTYIGGRGNDTLVGSEYADVYIHRLGDGADTLIDHADYASSGDDELRFEGIASADMTATREGDDLILRHANGSDRVTVKNWYADVYRREQVDRIVFTDTSWSADEASFRGQPPIVGTAGADHLTGTLYAERIVGLAGNDTLTADGGLDQLEGGDGDDRLEAVTMDSYLSYYAGVTYIGGRGNDTLIGTAFDDLYRFDLGDGADTLIDLNPSRYGASELRFGAGVAAADITLARVGQDLVFNHANGVDRITVQRWFSTDLRYNQIAHINFSDGTHWGASEVTDRLAWQSATGTAAADLLLGSDGADTLRGLGGDDLLMAFGTGDRLDGGDGNDILLAHWDSDAVNLLGGAGNDTLRGSQGADTLGGGAGDDVLDGGAGADALSGGAGNDRYVVDHPGDTTTESANGGTDTVESSIGWTLGARVESLVLSGSSDIDGTGNTLDNTLMGNAGNNRLDGAGGADTIGGGAGNDSLLGGAGNDQLAGGDGADTLLGGAGNDRYAGGLGADTLTDSAAGSNDVYVWGRGEGADTLSDAGGTDRLDVLSGVAEDQLWLRRVGSDLELSVIGTADTLTINGWYSNKAKRIESFHLADGQALQATQVQRLVDAMAAFAPPAAGQTTLPPSYQSALQPVIAPNWV